MVPRRWQRWPAEYDDDDGGGGDRVASRSFEVAGGRVASARKTRHTDRPPTATGASWQGMRTPPATIPTSIIIIIAGGPGAGAAGASRGRGTMTTMIVRQHNC
jgi:hypothetical protein